MPLYRDPATGLVVETDTAWANANGYSPVGAGEEASGLAAEGRAARGDERGVAGDVNSFGTGVLSGLTLGGTDALLGAGLTDDDREQLLSEINKHPIERGAGELVGGLAPAFVAPGTTLAKTPAGYLATLGADATESALARGGVAGTARALGTMGAEGAVANAGAYLGHVALEHKDVTVEGLAGAIGSGFEFGAVGGGAFLGISKGTMAARKMFSRVMDRGAEQVAESAWSTASQAQLEADAATADVARQRLEEIRSMKEEALRARQDAKHRVGEETIRAQAAGPEQPFKPEPVEAMFTPGGTQVIPGVRGASRVEPVASSIAPEPTATPIDPAEALRQQRRHEIVMTQPNEGTRVIEGGPPMVEGETVTPDFTAEPSGVKPPTEMEALGRGEAEAKRIASAAPAPTQERTGLSSILDELGEHQASEKPLSSSTSIEDLKVQPRNRMPFGNLRSRLAQQLLPDLRIATTTELLGKDIAAEEAKLLEALHEFQNAKNAFVEHIVANDAPASIKPKVPTDFAMPSKSRVGASPEEIIDLQRGQQTNPGRRGAFDILTEQHDMALDRLRAADNPVERGIALKEADHFEQLLERLAPPSPQKDVVPGDFLRSTARDAKVIDQYEKASKGLTEAVGDAAHPSAVEHAKAYDAANDEAVRKVTDRTSRALEDHETFGPFQYAGPTYKTPRERVVYAKSQHLEAQKAYTTISNEERVAQKAHDELNLKVKEGERAKKAALKLDAKAARDAAKTKSQIGLATGIGGVLEIANIPGLPKASDLPVVGPLLGAWLKYRAVKAALGRVGGRVPALADSRVAALAARTKDRVAMAVDRSLGLSETIARAGRKAAPLAAGVVTQRIYDDGLPAPAKDAGIQEHVAARVRELSSYVTTPGAIENDVRRELLGVTDPDIIQAAEQHRRAMMEYLLKNAPKMPQYGALQKIDWKPAPAPAMSFARRLEAANDPAGVLERLAGEQAQLSLEAAETLREVYPQLFTMAQQRVLDRAQELKTSVPYQQRIRLSLVYKLPLDAALDPDNLKISQSVYDRPQPSPTPVMGPAGGPPQPSIAQPTNLVPMYQNPADRQQR